MLTACGIETLFLMLNLLGLLIFVATVLTACGIETVKNHMTTIGILKVATVLTACGIETHNLIYLNDGQSQLQQCLPLAVLKH